MISNEMVTTIQMEMLPKPTTSSRMTDVQQKRVDVHQRCVHKGLVDFVHLTSTMMRSDLIAMLEVGRHHALVCHPEAQACGPRRQETKLRLREGWYHAMYSRKRLSEPTPSSCSLEIQTWDRGF